METTNWLITGAIRGIGRDIVAELLRRPQTTEFAGVRDPSAEAAVELKNLAVGSGSKLVIVKLDVANQFDNQAVVSTIKEHGVSQLDVVVANAGVTSPPRSALEVPENDFWNTFQANTLGPIFLF